MNSLFGDDSEAVKHFKEVAPNVVNIRCENAMLLGAPIGNSVLCRCGFDAETGRITDIVYLF